MFKNTVFNSKVDTLNWLKNAAIRALKTFAQTAASLVTVGRAVTDMDWCAILGISATAFVASILTSLAGIPEVEATEVAENKQLDPIKDDTK